LEDERRTATMGSGRGRVKGNGADAKKRKAAKLSFAFGGGKGLVHECNFHTIVCLHSKSKRFQMTNGRFTGSEVFTNRS
jgi:hypothetical protein